MMRIDTILNAKTHPLPGSWAKNESGSCTILVRQSNSHCISDKPELDIAYINKYMQPKTLAFRTRSQGTCEKDTVWCTRLRAVNTMRREWQEHHHVAIQPEAVSFSNKSIYQAG